MCLLRAARNAGRDKPEQAESDTLQGHDALIVTAKNKDSHHKEHTGTRRFLVVISTFVCHFVVDLSGVQKRKAVISDGL